MNIKTLLELLCVCSILVGLILVGEKQDDDKPDEQEILAEVTAQEIKARYEATPIYMKSAAVNEATVEKPINLYEEERFIGLDDIPLSADEQFYMQQVCRENDVDYAFALALMESESHFEWMVGDTNLPHFSVGYFQISQVNEERMQEDYELNIYEAFDNIEAGIKIISELQTKYATKTEVIMCYKCGEAGAKKLLDKGVILSCVPEIAERERYFDLEIDFIRGGSL